MDYSDTTHLFMWYDHHQQLYQVGNMDQFELSMIQPHRIKPITKFSIDHIELATSTLKQLNHGTE